MKRPEIIKVWGKADDIELNFIKEGTEWTCSVPADLVDGTYACELNAVNEIGNFGFWTGFLYMCSGICHFDLEPVKFRLFFDKIEMPFTFVYDKIKNAFGIDFEKINQPGISFNEQPERITFDRRCPHYVGRNI